MASQSNIRPQHVDYGDQSRAGGAPKDPLAELARLIGQDGSYTKMRQDAGHPHAAEPHRAAEPESWAHAEPSHDYQSQAQHAGHYAPDMARHADPRASHYADQQAPHAAHAYADQTHSYARQNYADPATQAYEDPAYDPAYDAEYDQAPVAPPRKSGALKWVAACAGLALIGTAGAYGYRSMGPSGLSGPPPVIKANESPTKIPGTPQAREPAGRTTFDRADKNAPERMVTREEQPVDIRAPSATPRIVGSSPTPNSTATTGSLSAPSGGGAAEPKKVKTERILPAGSAGPRSDAAPRVPTRTASIPANAPVVAATPPTPAPVASGHFVQVSSQKTERDAQASYRALQSKYPTVLSSRSPSIRKAELGGDRGTVYRVQVGPFASATQANELCTNLKTAGGQCMVARN